MKDGYVDVRLWWYDGSLWSWRYDGSLWLWHGVWVLVSPVKDHHINYRYVMDIGKPLKKTTI